MPSRTFDALLQPALDAAQRKGQELGEEPDGDQERESEAPFFDVEARLLSMPENSRLLTERDALCDSLARPWAARTGSAEGRSDIHPVRIASGLVGRRMAQTFATYHPSTPLQADAKRFCEKFAECYDPAFHDGGVPGLTLYSSSSVVGCGKSHLACAIGNALLARSFRPVRYMRIEQFLADLKAAFGTKGVDGRQGTVDVWRTYLSPRVVLLDDLGKESMGGDGEWALNQIFELVNEWDNLGTRVIRTTNDGAETLQQRYGKPLASRLMGLSSGRIIPVDGPDLREARPGYEDFFSRV